ncbi:MAG: phosphoribosylformylglycinamidine synthase subunit PurL [Armatimonadota bacterium]
MATTDLLDERIIPVSQLDDQALEAELEGHGVVLTPDEVRRVAEHLGRDPTLVELHIFNVEWSEHCSYRSSRATLKEFLPTTGPNVIMGPEEDAGIVELGTFGGRRYGVVIAHESHNHPSQILPNEGAATGIGGIVRDVDCMGAAVVATADPLRFGDPKGEHADRTRWIVRGVVDGIWQYGNALGVPNLAGDVVFADSFDDNCLVNVVAIGIVAEDEIIHSAVPPQAAEEPYDVILVGKPTDDSGFGGSAFASKILGDEEEKAEDRGAVQVPDPFLKNVLLMRKANEDVRRAAREQGVAIGIKDIGGGGLACGSSEIGAMGGFGVDIDLDKVHVGLENLLPETITCAETQERYILAVPQHFTPTVLRIYNEDWDLPNIYEGARAAVIGRVTEEKRYLLRHGGKIVADAPIEFVTSGIRYDREARPREYTGTEPDFEQPGDLTQVLLAMLGSENLASREYIYRAYDTEVQGNAVVRPGEADAGVIAPLPGETVGVALAVDSNPFYGAISPYWAAVSAVAECMRNVAAVGAVPSGLTDCLCFGNPEKPEVFWDFRESVRGLSDAAKSIWLKGQTDTPVPVISGNVSFYNESATGRAVLPSPIIACIGIMDDYSKAVTMQLRRPGNVLLLLGDRHNELGGSAYYKLVADTLGANVPQVRFEQERANIYTVIDAIDGGLVASCHDISNGGVLCTLAEMCMGGYAKGDCGAAVSLEAMANGVRADKALFSESGGFVLEVAAENLAEVRQIAAGRGTEVVEIGRVTEEPALKVLQDGKELVNCGLDDMKAAWTGGVASVLT